MTNGSIYYSGNFEFVMSFLYSPQRRKKYSVDKLRVAYADLLQHIDVANKDLGRRGIDEDDADIHKKSKRFSFRRNVIPATLSSPTKAATITSQKHSNNASEADSMEWEGKDAPNNVLIPANEKRDLAAAFRMMAATRSPDKEGDNFGAIAVREDSFVSVLSSAKAIEGRVVELIRTIGEIVVNADQTTANDTRAAPTQNSNGNGRSPSHVRSDPAFEYFCEKSILSLLVDIASEKRQGSEEGRRWGTESCFHGVVWSPNVKAQVFATVAHLISDSRNRSVLYYLLSHNYINALIQCMLPLQQWTDQALSKMMPPYVEMLQKVAVQLANDPHLFPFLLMEASSDGDENSTFPLFSAALETATGSFAQSDSIVYGTCLVVAVNIMQILHAPIQSWVCDAGLEQRRLADHLCQRLLDRYYRIVNLTTGPVVDGVRSNAVTGQLSGLKDHLSMIHEVFWSGVRGLDVRLCESLLQRVVTVLLKNLAPSKRRSFLTDVGLVDADVIPEQEALAQVSTLFLAFLFTGLAYVPFQRMMAVALFHEKSTPLWSSAQLLDGFGSSETYIFMPLLSDIVTGDHDRETCPNQFRSEIIKGVAGKYGDWRTTACACLLQTALASEAVDDESLGLLKLIPAANEESGYRPTALEEAIATFLSREHKPSAVAAQTLEFVGVLAIQVLYKIILKFANGAMNTEDRIQFVLANSPVWKALVQIRSYFAIEAKKYQMITGVSDIFLDLVESAITTRYTARYDESGAVSFRCPLSQRGYASTSMSSAILVRKVRSVTPNDVETTRFHVNMTFHFRSLCKVVDRLCLDVQKEARTQAAAGGLKKIVALDLVDKADDLTRTIGGLAQKPEIGANLDLTGRMTFRFQSAVTRSETTVKTNGEKNPERTSMGVFRSNTRLVLVADPTDMFVVQPMKSQLQENRGTVLCTISLRSVIAAAHDGEWLHVAVRHEDVGLLIKNGNMALKFENNGACLIVKQYLDRSREVLRRELLDKVSTLLTDASSADIERPPEIEDQYVPKVNTF